MEILRTRILYIITKSIWGGAQKYVFDLATNLPKDRFDVAVAMGGSGVLFEALQKHGVRTLQIPGMQRDIAIFKEFFVVRQLYRTLKQEKPDVVHLNSSKAGGLGAVAAFFYNLLEKKRTTIIFTVHGWGFKENLNLASQALRFLASWVTTIFCDFVIVISKADFEAALHFILKRKIHLIYNGAPPVSFVARTEARSFLAQKVSHELRDDEVLIGTTAELTPNKGLSYFISALGKLSAENLKLNYTAVVMGEGEEREALQKQINDLRLAKQVFLAGFVPKAAEYFKGLDIFVLPSLKEGLPYTILEAMQAGLPVIATKVGGIPDQIDNEKTGLLIESKNAMELGKTLKKLILNRERGRALGKAAKEKAESLFSFDLMLNTTIKLYRE